MTNKRILLLLTRTFRRSSLISQIRATERKLSASTGQESKKYELELIAFRQQIRLLDSHLSLN